MDTQSNSRRALKSVQEQEHRRQWWNERDRAQRAAETVEQRSEQLRKRRERDRARHAVKTASERQATGHTGKVPMNIKERQLRPLRREPNIAVDEHQPAWKVRQVKLLRWEMRLQQMKDRLAADQELLSPQDVDPYDAHLARTFVPNTAQRLRPSDSS